MFSSCQIAKCLLRYRCLAAMRQNGPVRVVARPSVAIWSFCERFGQPGCRTRAGFVDILGQRRAHIVSFQIAVEPDKRPPLPIPFKTAQTTGAVASVANDIVRLIAG
ncbi:MAG: hypothetical protein R3F53_14885 [Gammaproteobacteria bacterium]